MVFFWLERYKKALERVWLPSSFISWKRLRLTHRRGGVFSGMWAVWRSKGQQKPCDIGGAIRVTRDELHFPHAKKEAQNPQNHRVSWNFWSCAATQTHFKRKGQHGQGLRVVCFGSGWESGAPNLGNEWSNFQRIFTGFGWGGEVYLSIVIDYKSI